MTQISRIYNLKSIDDDRLRAAVMSDLMNNKAQYDILVETAHYNWPQIHF